MSSDDTHQRWYRKSFSRTLHKFCNQKLPDGTFGATRCGWSSSSLFSYEDIQKVKTSILINFSFVPISQMNSNLFPLTAMGDEQHPWMDAGGSSGHGGPGEREAPIAVSGKTISLKGKF